MSVEQKEKKDLATMASGFLAGKKGGFFGITALLILLIIGVAVFSEVNRGINEAASALAEDLSKQYQSWKDKAPGAERDQLELEVLAKAQRIINEYGANFAAARALDITASLHFEKKNWALASEQWESLASRFSSTHLAPIAMLNASAAYEEAGNLEKAIAQLEKIRSNYKDFPLMPRVVFTIARIKETAGDFATAATLYTELVDRFGSSDWTNLAKSRLIALRIEGKIQ